MGFIHTQLLWTYLAVLGLIGPALSFHSPYYSSPPQPHPYHAYLRPEYGFQYDPHYSRPAHHANPSVVPNLKEDEFNSFLEVVHNEQARMLEAHKAKVKEDAASKTGPHASTHKPQDSQKAFRFLEESLGAKEEVSTQAKQKLKSKVHAGADAEVSVMIGGGFPEQSFTYKNLNSPPAWLVPKQMQPPGLPITKPPPVPQMVPPPPPFPPTLDNKGPYSGEGQDYSPPAPTYALPRPPPAALPRWIPWSAYYVPKAAQS